MIARAAAALAVSIAALAAVSAAGGQTGQTACTAGMTTIGGQPYRVFCGPAKATVKVGGKTLSFTGGTCDRSSGTFTINVGAVYLGATSGKPARSYFGITAGNVPGGSVIGDRPVTGDGTYRNVSVAFNVGGARYLVLRAAVTLKHGRTAGSFTGPLFGKTGTAAGVFTC